MIRLAKKFKFPLVALILVKDFCTSLQDYSVGISPWAAKVPVAEMAHFRSGFSGIQSSFESKWLCVKRPDIECIYIYIEMVKSHQDCGKLHFSIFFGDYCSEVK